MQGAKGTASDLRAAVKAAKGEAEALADLLDGKTAMDAAGEAGGALEKLVEKVQGPEGGSLKPYVTITYLVDKEFESAPSTCGGTPLGVPLAGATAEACAAACDTDVQNCNGFSYFGGEGPRLHPPLQAHEHDLLHEVRGVRVPAERRAAANAAGAQEGGGAHAAGAQGAGARADDARGHEVLRQVPELRGREPEARPQREVRALPQVGHQGGALLLSRRRPRPPQRS